MFEQDRVLVRLRQRVVQDKEIKVCFLTGSYGRGSQDKYSDIDVALVFEDERALEAAYSQRREFVRSVLPFVPAKSYDADHVRPYLHSALYGNGTKVDYQYADMKTMTPGDQFRKLLLIKDTEDGWGRQLQLSSEKLTEAAQKKNISLADFSEMDEVFWVLFLEVFRQVSRGDQITPFDTYLHLVYNTLPNVLSLIPSDQPIRYFLARSLYDDDPSITLKFLRQLLVHYLEARRIIVQYYDLDFELDKAFENEMIRIVS